MFRFSIFLSADAKTKYRTPALTSNVFPNLLQEKTGTQIHHHFLRRRVKHSPDLRTSIVSVQPPLLPQSIFSAHTRTLTHLEDEHGHAASGHLPIDNNPVKNTIRPIAVGKKNWLFAGSERAGQRAAAIQSLLATAKLNGLEPYAWIKDTLEKLPGWPYSRMDELLPLKVVDGV